MMRSIWATTILSLLVQIILLNVVYGFAPLRNSIQSFRKLASSLSDEPAIRIGHGFDIHRLIEGTKLIIGTVRTNVVAAISAMFCGYSLPDSAFFLYLIGGVDVPFHVGADAHSDGDAMYHR